MDIAEDAGGQVDAMPVMPGRQEFRFELGDIDRRGAFGGAGFAAQAEIQHRFDGGIAQVLRQNATDGGAQGVGAPSRRMRLIQRRLIRRAHRAGTLLAANASAIAHLDRAGETVVGPPIVARIDLDHLVFRRISQQLGAIHRRRIDDLARVHHIVGIEGALDPAKSVHQFGTE